MVNREDMARELLARRNAIGGFDIGPSGGGVRRLDDNDGNPTYNAAPIIPPQIKNRLEQQEPLQSTKEIIPSLPVLQKYNAFNVVEVKKIESPLLKEIVKKWFDFCLSSDFSFKETITFYNVQSKEKTFEMVYNIIEETAFVDMDGNIVTTQTKNVNDVLNQLIFTKNQLASLFMRPMFVGKDAPFVKVSGYSDFLVGRDENSLQLAKRIVNALNFLSSVPDELLDFNKSDEIIAFLIRLEQQKENKINVVKEVKENELDKPLDKLSGV